MRNLIMVFVLSASLFAKVTVLPTQGRVGDDFHFKVTLTPQERENYTDIFLRIFEKESYYDYKMEQDKEGNYCLTLPMHEEALKKEFTVGLQDLHGQISWKKERFLFRVLEYDSKQERSPSSAKEENDSPAIDYAIQALQNVFACLHKKRGYTVWNGVKKYGCWVRARSTYCARFVRMCYGEEVKYGSAIAMYRHYKKAKVVQKEGTPPPGAVVFYATKSKLGHTGIADGEGGLYSASSYVKGIKHDKTFSDRGKYLGFVTAEDFKKYY